MQVGNNTIESYKAAKGGDGLRILEDMPRITSQPWDALSAADKDLLKWVGIFFRKPTPGEFMMRIRMPNGFTNSAQLRTIADLSRRLGNCVLDITTRQQIQLRGFAIGSVPEIWERLRGVDLHSLQTGMDNVRNINGCALAGLMRDELLDASKVVFELDHLLVGSDGNPEFTDLPRKFNITITGCLANCTHAESQDIALVPAIKDGRSGFNVLVGGKMGSGGFTIASPLDVFVEPCEAAGVTAELVRMFRDHGPRDARAKIRFAFLVEKWGIERLHAELQARVGRELESPGAGCRRHDHADHLGVTPQKPDGLVAVGMGIPTGRLRPNQMEELAALADNYGNGEVRLTTSQNAIVPNVAADRVEELLREPLLQAFSPNPSPFMRGMVACTGSDYCNLAQIQTKKLALELSAALEKRFGNNATPLTINWSGCVAGCGNHQASDIGFRGMKVNVGNRIIEAVAIYAGGRTGPDAVAGEQILDVVPCDDSLADLVADVMLKRGLVNAPALQTAPQDFVPVEVLASQIPHFPTNTLDAPTLGGD